LLKDTLYMRTIRLLLSFFAALGCSSGLAATINVNLDCTYNGPVSRTGCTVAQPTSIANLTEDMDASWTVSYSFPCKGHRTSLAFHTGDKHVALEYTDGGRPINEFTADGRGPLTFLDQDITASRRATLVGACALTVHSVSIAPSLRAIGDWKEKAEDQAQIIDLSLTVYELASDFRSYMDWDRRQTTTMLNSARLKVKLFEPLCDQGDQTACRSAAHFRVIVGALEAKQKGTPSPPIADEAGELLLATYKKDLDDEVQLGRDMVTRFQRWNLAVTQELQDILAVIPQ